MHASNTAFNYSLFFMYALKCLLTVHESLTEANAQNKETNVENKWANAQNKGANAHNIQANAKNKDT